MRLFIAINVDPALRSEIHRDTAALRAVAPEVSWIRADSLHLTIRFLGDTGDERAPALEAALLDVGRRHWPFALELAGAGTFPNFRHPRVVWIGVKDDTQVGDLARDIDACCAAQGFPGEKRPFSAHLTLGRVRKELPAGRLRALEEAARQLDRSYCTSVDRFDLMRSELTPQGSQYSVVASVPLLRT